VWPKPLAVPIRLRIALFGIGVVTLTVALFSFVFYALLASGVPAEQDLLLRQRAEATRGAVERASAADIYEGRVLVPFDGSDALVEVLGSDGSALSGGPERAVQAVRVPHELLAAATATGSASGIAESATGDSQRVLVLTWSRPDLGVAGHVVAAQSTERVRKNVEGLRAFLILSAVITLLAVSGAIWTVAGRALQPLKTMARAADDIRHTQDLSRRLPVGRARDEVSQLAASFNGMLARLQDAYQKLSDALESQRRLVADASHELRTPITSIYSNAGFLLGRADARPEDIRAALEDIANESERMGRLVQNLLTLARVDSGHLQLEKVTVDLEVLVREVCGQAMALHPERSFRVRAPADAVVGNGAPMCVTANEDALKQVLWILIDNAVKHTRAGGNVWLTMSRVSRGDAAPGLRLYVADDGAGIPEADLERIFDRFYRADPARSGDGTGLGLAIARWIVSEHGGWLNARNNDLGGATFLIDLPPATLAPDSDDLHPHHPRLLPNA
jgi:signal transduction histidine kinase